MAANIATLASPDLLRGTRIQYGCVLEGLWLSGRAAAGRARRSLCVMTGIPDPLFNAVYRARLADDTVEVAVEEIRLAAAQWNVPLFWWLTPTTTPPDLGATLLQHGFVHAGNVPGMAVELARLDTRQALPRDSDRQSRRRQCHTGCVGGYSRRGYGIRAAGGSAGENAGT